MNKSIKFFVLVLTVVLSLSAFVACDLLEGIKPDGNGNSDGTGNTGNGHNATSYTLDVYSLNDVHGKFEDGDSQPGVDEMTTYLRKMQSEKNALLLSAGDMWQGSAESGLTKGNIITDWMNDLDFTSMTLGNHEFDWGTDEIEDNADIAKFPLLAINVYDVATNERVDYCDASVLVDKGTVQIGVIGAVGDCYSSISADQVEDVYFKTDDDLTALVKAESTKLKSEGADFIIYVLHDGYGRSTSSEKYMSGDDFSNDEGVYYDTSLSNGYVDLVFEGHSHKSYILKDEYGVYHLQGGGDNNKGMTHAQVVFDLASNTTSVRDAGFIAHSVYTSMAEDPIVDDLIEKYNSILGSIYYTIGINAYTRDSSDLKSLTAQLYYEAGVEEWGDTYDIVLGGGYLSVRSPYDLPKGAVDYATLYMLMPFDNDLVLCSIKGSDLKRRYLENGSYYIYLGDYGNSVRGSIVDSQTYYIITDTYNSSYAPNKLTVVASLSGVYARDLIAAHIKQGKLS